MIFVVARSQEHGNTFIKNHPTLAQDLVIKTGQTSYFGLINEIITGCQEPVACIVHDDVMLCQDFNKKIKELLNELNANWKTWGLVGNAGVSPVAVGLSAQHAIRYLSDPHGGPNFSGTIFPAFGVDGNVMLLNVAAMRERNLKLPNWKGFHLYDIILSIETLAAGLSVLVAPQLACWHGSPGDQLSFERAKSSDEFHTYLRQKVQHIRLTTMNGFIDVKQEPKAPLTRGPLDLELQSLMNAASPNRIKKLAIVIRSQFKRPSLLRRTLESIKAFKENGAENVIDCRVHIVTDQNDWRSKFDDDTVSVISVAVNEGVDSRFILVNAAVKQINADYFWFIDDDDWLFPNEAKRLYYSIATAPDDSMIFLGCQNFHEKLKDGQESQAFPRAEAGRYYSASDFVRSLTGHNHTPFPGAIYPKKALLSIPDSAFATINYFEDFFILQHALLSCKFTPVIVDKLFVGISIREFGNTVTEKDRTKWNKSTSEVVSQLSGYDRTAAQMLSLSAMVRQNQILIAAPKFGFLGRLLLKISGLKLRRVFSFMVALMRGDITLSALLKKI